MQLLPRGQASRILQQCCDQGSTGGTAYEQDLVDLVWPFAGVGEGPMHAVERPFQERADELFVFAAGYLHVEMHRHAVALGQMLLAQAGIGLETEALFRFFDGMQQPTHGLDKALTFRDDQLLPATSHALERGNRRYRKMQRSVYRVRTQAQIRARLAPDMWREAQAEGRQQTLASLHRAELAKPGRSATVS